MQRWRAQMVCMNGLHGMQTIMQAMSKAFTKETDRDDDAMQDAAPALPGGVKNYITPQGYARLRAELMQLIDEERPKIVEVVH